jgi:hypothetical protein
MTMSENYDRNSTDATISRIEAKLDITLQRLDKHGSAIDALWKAVGSIDVRVACITATVCGAIFMIKLLFSK